MGKDRINHIEFPDDGTASPESDWEKQALRTVHTWLLTYLSAVIILLIVDAEHVFALAFLPTLSTVFSSRALFNKIVKKCIRAMRNPR